MIILNFSHPLTEKQEKQIKDMLKVDDKEWNTTKLFRVDCYLNIDKPFGDQISDILGSITMTDKEWSGQILVVPPPISASALMLVLGISSKCGYVPSIVRMKKKRSSSPPEYVIAEIINLQGYKDYLRSQRNTQKVVIKTF